MLKITILIGFIFVTISSSRSFAGIVRMQGVGTESCGSFVSAIEDHGPGEILKSSVDEIFYTEINTKMQWIFGFIAAKNWNLSDKNQIIIDRDGTAMWIKNYCEKNPTRPIVNAVSKFIKEHSKKQKT